MKYIKTIIFLIFVSTIISLSSCVNCVEPEGEMKTRSIKLDNFTKIDIEIPSNIKLITGDSASIVITAPESILAQILPIVKRNRLNLEGNICNVTNDQINIEVTVPNISSVKIKGSAKLYSEMPVRSDELDMIIDGSGSISLNVFANEISAKMNGSGVIIINGTCKELDIDIVGSGNFKGLGLNTYKADVKSEGSGNASIVALNKLKAVVKGSGEIRYSGEPELSINIAGSGKVTKIN
jgi:hypothetical protein